jgi:hypothetical protein
MNIVKQFLNLFSSTYEFKKDENGKHQIGGELPNNFKIPESNFISNYQYLGFIEKDDKAFDWLSFKLHLICPIYLDIDKVYLDYTDSLSPKLLLPKNEENVTSAYDELNKESIIIYEEVKVKLEKVPRIDELESIGTAGKPAWLQNSEFPLCPKSGKKMKFLCTLMSFGGIKTKYTNIVSEYPDFNQMTFWGDGNLYVFVEPNEKTVCYFIQNT